MGTSEEGLVQLTRVLRAPPGEVFAAWTDPALLERWWTGVGGWVDAKADVDLRVGGRYHLSMRDERGAQHGVLGVYTEVVPAERLVFTWSWENDPSVMRGSEGSLVDVVLRDAPDGTQLSLTHTGLGGKLVKDMHEEGWNALLTSLYGLFSAEPRDRR
jgi:uncharacterized protein YndB with AHSA1/START domain